MTLLGISLQVTMKAEAVYALITRVHTTAYLKQGGPPGCGTNYGTINRVIVT